MPTAHRSHDDHDPAQPLGVRVPRLVPLDAEHERQALDALAALLAADLMLWTDDAPRPLKVDPEVRCPGRRRRATRPAPTTEAP